MVLPIVLRKPAKNIFAQMGFLHISVMAPITSLIPAGFFDYSFFFLAFRVAGVTFSGAD